MRQTSVYLAIPVVVLLVLVQACASSGQSRDPNEPAWIGQASHGLPDSAYISAVGVGRSRVDAEEAALVNLAREIQTRVTSFETIQRISGEYSEGGVTRSTNERVTLEHQLLVETNREFLGVDIRDAWQDPKTGIFHARATMDRTLASRVYGREIERLHASILTAIDEPDEQTSALGRIRALRIAREQTARMQDLIETRRLIDPGASQLALSATPSFAELGQRIREIQQICGVAIRAEGEGALEMQPLLEQAIEDQELLLTARSQAVIEIVLQFELTHNPSFDPNSQASRWRVVLESIDLETGLRIDRADFSGAVTARSRRAAESDAAAAARRALNAEIGPFLEQSLRRQS